MADIITRFKLETTQYDSKLRDASKELAEYTRKATEAGNEFGKFTQKNIEAARALGNITPSATNAKDKVKELVGAFNDAAKAYNALTKEQQQSDFGKALSGSLTQLQQHIRGAKEEMQGLNDTLKGSGGGDSLRGMLEVFGGNMMTKAVELIGKLSDEVVQVLNESSRLSMEAEGIQIAFERLGRGDLLEGLRKATHNTVSDLELMKAAVKFNDFKLSLDELGTMLAFAQQKAKDTGQSVDYMVDSIVTGLGRQSLMILDNLGLSASDVKEKMKETGDMTKAVGAIIRQQMSEAGEYVETASDKATQAQVELQNAMLELGNSMRETFGYTGWADMAAGIKTELVGAIQFTIDTINEAKNAWRELKALFTGGGNAKGDVEEFSQRMGARSVYEETRDEKGNLVKATRNGKDVTKEVLESEGVTITAKRPTAPKTKTTRSGRGGGGTTIQKTEEQLNDEQIKKLTNEYIKATDARREAIIKEIDVLQKRNTEIKNLKDEALNGKMVVPLDKTQSEILAGLKRPEKAQKLGGEFVDASPLKNWNEQLEKFTALRDKALTSEQWKAFDDQIKSIQGKMDNFTGKGMVDSWKEAANAIGAVGNALQSIENPAVKIAGLIGEAIANIALGFAQATASDSKFGVFGWISAIAGGLATMTSTISAIKSATAGSYAYGGIVPGNNFSGDNNMIAVNSGELILTRAMQSNLASQLSTNSLSNLNLTASLSGETITLALNANSRRRGRGEFATTKIRHYGNVDA